MGKPGGLLVHRSREASDRVALLQIVRDRIGRHLYPIHRLDRAASGVILFALDSGAAAATHAALAAPDALKSYRVLVRGSTDLEFESRRPLHSEAGKPQEAHTSFRRLAEIDGFTLLEARLHSGRRHQIRRHLAHLAHQVVGDVRYGKGRLNRRLREEYGLPRLFLHAQRVSCAHPDGERRLDIEAPLAPDLAGFLDRLGEKSRGGGGNRMTRNLTLTKCFNG